MKAWQGSYGVSLHEGIVSPAYFVSDVLDIDPAFPAPGHSGAKAYVPLFDRASDGVRIGQWELSHGHLRDIPIAIPPLNEQAAIVRYLDHADELISRYIRRQRAAHRPAGRPAASRHSTSCHIRARSRFAD